MAKLILLAGGQSTPFELTQDETVLGRHPECTIVVDSNMVSRKHAKLTREGSDYFIEDMGSGNGTTVNAQRIAAPGVAGVTGAQLLDEEWLRVVAYALAIEEIAAGCASCATWNRSARPPAAA